MKLKILLALTGLTLTISSVFADSERVGEIRDTDRIYRRVESRDYSFFSFGPSVFNNLDADNTGVGLAYGHIWETTTWAAVKASIDGAFHFEDTYASVVTGTLGANFYFTPSSISPYIGFELGYGGAVTDADEIDNVAGWAGGATLGLALFRTSSTQMHITARYLQIFKDNDEGQPSQATFGLGIAF